MQRALKDYAAPPNTDVPAGFGAFEVFTGYLVLDALIANTDRHDRNWSVMRPQPDDRRTQALCASYDHAAAFGIGLREDQRASHVATGTVGAWARAGKAKRFERPWSTLVDLAGAAALLCEPPVGAHWRQAVMSLDRDYIDSVVARTPDLSESTRNFISEVIMINRERLNDALH